MKIIYIFFKVTLTKVSNAYIYMYKQYFIIRNKRFLFFQTKGLYFIMN